MANIQTIQKMLESGLVAIVRAENEDKAVKIADACAKGGVSALEITYTVPGATRAIEKVAQECAKSSKMLIGAGTVLDTETCRTAILAGAQFIVTPCLNVDVVRMCNRYDIPCCPGVMTVREVVEALDAGAAVLKAFPGEVLGPAFIKAVLGPIPHAKLIPTGGVALDNIDKWLKAGSVAIGVGGNLTAGAKTGDYDAVTQAARQFTDRIAQVRAELKK